VLELNKKDRNKMNIIKEGITNTEVIIQEGIPTVDVVGGLTAEPMIYLVNAEPVACIYRTNSEKDRFSNLNAKGMQFSSDRHFEAAENLCPIQGLVARLAALAAAKECYEPSWII
jgi:glutamate--cysteine ligase